MSRDEKLVCCGMADGQLVLYDKNTGKVCNVEVYRKSILKRPHYLLLPSVFENNALSSVKNSYINVPEKNIRIFQFIS